ncbi:MAG: hypothetical protein KBC02_03575 [Candidatus Pacebacteria bacterium]|nr:hypothetical protein [Candidatus Paceibacterota bacterium]
MEQEEKIDEKQPSSVTTLHRRKSLEQRAPISYRNRRRPPLFEAMQLENTEPITSRDVNDDTLARLERKGFFSPRPWPWRIGFRDRGHGHGDYAIIDRFGDPVAENISLADIKIILKAMRSLKRRKHCKS